MYNSIYSNLNKFQSFIIITLTKHNIIMFCKQNNNDFSCQVFNMFYLWKKTQYIIQLHNYLS